MTTYHVIAPLRGKKPINVPFEEQRFIQKVLFSALHTQTKPVSVLYSATNASLLDPPYLHHHHRHHHHSFCCISIFFFLSPSVLCLSQGFLQTPELPQSSGGELLRCHSLLESAAERKGRLSHNWKGGEKKLKLRGAVGDISEMIWAGKVSTQRIQFLSFRLLENPALCIIVYSISMFMMPCCSRMEKEYEHRRRGSWNYKVFHCKFFNF